MFVKWSINKSLIKYHSWFLFLLTLFFLNFCMENVNVPLVTLPNKNYIYISVNAMKIIEPIRHHKKLWCNFNNFAHFLKFTLWYDTSRKNIIL